MRAIDADALKEDLTRFYDNEVTARKLIDEQPTIQPEIVQCKDCKYHHKRICPIERYFSLDGFCSRGKRREVTTWQMK